MHDAAVGFQCPACVAEGRKSVREPRTIAGGRIRLDAGRISLGIIAVNVVVYLAQVATSNSQLSVTSLGAMQSYDVAAGQYWRLLTSEFLHGGLIHLALNMVALYLFGPVAERVLGTSRFVATYVTLAVGASTFVYLFSAPNDLTTGASGAIFGLFGLVFVLMIRAGQDVRSLLVLLAINAFISLQNNISWQAHLGGFLAGVALGGVYGYAPRGSRAVWQVAAFAIIWLGIVVAVVNQTMSLNAGVTG
jgi:membrane associated rhomboid family serine protease